MLLDGASLSAAMRWDRPLLVIDTCSLLDVLRDPTRPETERDRGRLVRSLADELENGLVNGLIVHQTLLELASHEEEVQTAAKAGIDRMKKHVSEVNQIIGSYGEHVGVDLSHFDIHAQRSKDIFDRWRAAIHVYKPSDRVFVRAIDRMNQARTPSRKGKSEAKDCIVVESMLEEIEILRDDGFVSPCVFLSSNKNDYVEALTPSKIKPDLGADFDALDITYAVNFSLARHLCGLR